MELADLPVVRNKKSIAADAGQDLAYEPEFLALEQAATGRSEQQFGSTIIPAESPDWREVERLASQLLERTRDLRIIGYLTRAWTEIHGLPGYAKGLALAADTLQAHWPSVHPQLSQDGEEDPMPRINALAALADPGQGGRSARSANLLDDVHGRLSLREAEAVLDGQKSEAQTYPGGRARLVEALRRAWLQETPAVRAVPETLAALDRIKHIVATELGTQWAPDYLAIEKTLSSTAQIFNVKTSHADAAETGPQSGADGAFHPAIPAPAARAGEEPRGVVRTREEARDMIERVCRYFEQHEPSHPAPYLLRRAEHLISLNFREILQDLVPQGLAQFETWLPADEARDPASGVQSNQRI